MENIADALRMAFAGIVFVVAMWIALAMIGQANATAREIFYGMDDTTYLDSERTVSSSDATHRTVGLETIVPTIYRYWVENCGVTIIDKNGNLVARYDLETDNIASFIRDEQPNESLEPNARKNYDKYIQHAEYIASVVKWTDEEGNEKSITGGKEAVAERLKELYKYSNVFKDGTEKTYYGAPWGTSYVEERLASDFYGEKSTYGSSGIEGKKYCVFKDGLSSNNNNYGLLNSVGSSKQYKEYIIEEGTKYTINNSIENNNSEEINISEMETTKPEIIYVEQ